MSTKKFTALLAGAAISALAVSAALAAGASPASHTIVSAPSSTERVAPWPPISVRTHPGQTEFTANFGSAAASCEVTPFNAVFEMQ